MDQLATQFFPSVEVEFHTQAIASRRDDPWASLPTSKTHEILTNLCRVLTTRQVVLFGIALEKATTAEPVARAFEELCSRFDLFLKRLHAQGNTQRGLIIFDKTRYETRLQTLLTEYRSGGTRFGGVKNFADVPLFASSAATRLLQLADLVAYALFRRYERGDTRLLDMIISKFDSDGVEIHGLVHLAAAGSTCTCPYCVTRRLLPRT